MRVAIIFPIPCDALDLFRPDVQRFFRTLLEFDAGYDYELIPVLSHFSYTEDEKRFIPLDDLLGEANEMVSDFITYTGRGCDIGSHQHAAHTIDHDLMVCCSSRVYFHRDGWLERVVQTFTNYAGLIGAMGSNERAPHVRTCFYAVAPAVFRMYPHLIRSREDTFKFETGEWNFTRWMLAGSHQVTIPTWEGWLSPRDWRHPSAANIFRRGDQSNILAWDRHTEIWSKATPEEQRRLTAYADGPAR